MSQVGKIMELQDIQGGPPLVRFQLLLQQIQQVAEHLLSRLDGILVRVK